MGIGTKEKSYEVSAPSHMGKGAFFCYAIFIADNLTTVIRSPEAFRLGGIDGLDLILHLMCPLS